MWLEHENRSGKSGERDKIQPFSCFMCSLCMTHSSVHVWLLLISSFASASCSFVSCFLDWRAKWKLWWDENYFHFAFPLSPLWIRGIQKDFVDMINLTKFSSRREKKSFLVVAKSSWNVSRLHSSQQKNMNYNRAQWQERWEKCQDSS